MSAPLTVTVSGAAGQIGYALLPLLANGAKRSLYSLLWRSQNFAVNHLTLTPGLPACLPACRTTP